MATRKDKKGVKFVRIKGKIVPIRSKDGDRKPKKAKEPTKRKVGKKSAKKEKSLSFKITEVGVLVAATGEAAVIAFKQRFKTARKFEKGFFKGTSAEKVFRKAAKTSVAGIKFSRGLTIAGGIISAGGLALGVIGGN